MISIHMGKLCFGLVCRMHCFARSHVWLWSRKHGHDRQDLAATSVWSGIRSCVGRGVLNSNKAQMICGRASFIPVINWLNQHLGHLRIERKLCHQFSGAGKCSLNVENDRRRKCKNEVRERRRSPSQFVLLAPLYRLQLIIITNSEKLVNTTHIYTGTHISRPTYLPSFHKAPISLHQTPTSSSKAPR